MTAARAAAVAVAVLLVLVLVLMLMLPVCMQLPIFLRCMFFEVSS